VRILAPAVLAPATLATLATGVVLAITLSAGTTPALPVVTTGAAHTALIAAAERADGDDAQRAKLNYRSDAEFSVLIHHTHKGHEYTLRATSPITTVSGNKPGDEGTTTWGYVKSTPVTAADAEAWRADGSPEVDASSDGPISPIEKDIMPAPDEEAVFEGDLSTMPTDPVELREAMLDWVADVGEWWTHLPGLSRRPKDEAAWLFREGTQLLTDDYSMSSAKRASLYKMMAGLPGVHTLSDTDPIGRPAVGLALTEKSEKYGTMEWQVFLDPKQDQVLGTQSVVRKPGSKNSHLKADTVYSRYIVKSSGYKN
jgi:hypothetical protein